jgi:hypothetical protein
VRVSAARESRASFFKFWDTSRRLALLSSRFPSKPRASELPQQLASNLLRLDHHRSVALGWTWEKPDEDRVNALFSSLKLGRCLMMLNLPTNSPPVSFDGSLLSEQAAVQAGFINGTEKWYGTPYLATGISLEQLQAIDGAAAHLDSHWKLPAGNRFIPEDVSLVSGKTDVEPNLSHSAQLSGSSSSKSQVWHALDTSFGSPKQVCLTQSDTRTRTFHQSSFVLLLTTSVQYTHLETFCSSPPSASALSHVTAAVMSKLIANNLLPQVRVFVFPSRALRSSPNPDALSFMTLALLDCLSAFRPLSLDGGSPSAAGPPCHCRSSPPSFPLSTSSLTPAPRRCTSLDMIPSYVPCRFVVFVGTIHHL